MLLSIAMIVKNEEKHLEECLKALKPLQKHLKAEIVLVDTGSTDNTLNIAKKYADKIYEVEWNGNFADMRNISISKCSGQWIMIVDGDEILNNSYEIISFFKSGIYKKFKAGMLEIRNFTNTNNKLAEEKYAIAYLVRLFKKREGMYVGRVHEQPQVTDGIVMIESYLNHYGYVSNDANLMKYKFERNTKLLFEDLENDATNKYTLFQLSNSFGMYGDSEKALLYISKAYNEIKTDKDIISFGYIIQHYIRQAFVNAMYVETISACKKLLEANIQHLDTYYYLGEAYANLGDNINAALSYEKFIKLRENYYSNNKNRDLTMITYNYGEYDYILSKYALINSQCEKYMEVIKTIEKIKCKKTLQTTFKIYIEALIKLNKISQIYKVYKNIEDLDGKELYADILENELKKNDEDIRSNVYSLFTDDESIYGFYVKCSLQNNYDMDEIIEKFDEIRFDNVSEFKAHFVYVLIMKDIKYFAKMKRESIKKYLNIIFKLYPASILELFEICIDNSFEIDLQKNNIFKSILLSLLISDKLNNEDYMFIFNKYIIDNLSIIKFKYNEEMLLLENRDLITDDEEKFSLLIYEAMKNKKNNKIKYIKLLRKALDVCSHHKRAIEYMMKWVDDIQISTEMKSLLNNMKQQVEIMINNEKYDEAENVVKQIEDLFGHNEEVINIKAIICYYRGQLQDCKKNLMSSLFLNDANKDTLMNIATISEIEQKNKIANAFYNKVSNSI